MAKKQDKIIRYLNTGILPATICLSIGFCYDELNKHLKGEWRKAISKDKDLIDSGKYFALYRTIKRKKDKSECRYFYLIITEPFLFNDESYIILAHEVLHLCQFLMPQICDTNREIEFEAYMHSHIMRQAIEEIRKS